MVGHMPVSAKGRKLKRALFKEYGKNKGARVFYGMENSGGYDWIKK